MARLANANTERIETASSAVPSGVRTFAGWFWVPNGTPGGARYFAKSSNTNFDFGCYHFNSGGSDQFRIEAARSGSPTYTNYRTNEAASTYEDGWFNLICEQDFSDLTVDPVLIANGTTLTWATATGRTGGLRNTSAQWAFGGDDNNSTYIGYFAQIGWWDRSLTAAEVSALAAGVHPMMFAPTLYIPCANGFADWTGNESLTNQSTTDDPRMPPVFWPTTKPYVFFSASGDTLTVPLIDVSATINAAQIDQTITAGLFDASATIAAPQIDQTVTASLVDASATLNAPQVDQTITASLVNTSATINAPQLDQTITAGLFGAAPTIFAPTVSEGTALSPGLFDASASIFTPQLDQTVTAALVSVSATVNAPQLDQVVTAGLFSAAPTINAPSVSLGLAAPLFDASATVFGPQLDLQIAAAFLDASVTVFGPTVLETIVIAPRTYEFSVAPQALAFEVVRPRIARTLPAQSLTTEVSPQ